jgi:uncharacterized membrane protein
VDLQINILTEQETTRILAIVTELSRRMDLAATRDLPAEAAHPLEKQTDIAAVMDTIDTLEQKLEPKGAAGPSSASDTDV